MAISVEEAMGAYGYVYTIANAIPELRTILQSSIAAGDTADNLTAKIESSSWWMQNADTARNLAVQAASEPGTYAQNLANAKNLVSLKAQQLGRTLNDGTLTALALQTLTSNASWDDSVLSQAVTKAGSFASEGLPDTYAGTAAQMQTHMNQVAESYGIPITDSQMGTWIGRVQSGADSLDGFESLVKARAKASYPQFADQIDAGQTVRDIADPYISTMAQTLEIPETSITLKDSYVQKALGQRNPDGTATSQPLWKFQQDLKRDPRYDQTTQAKTDAFTTLAHIGKDWGFEGAGS